MMPGDNQVGSENQEEGAANADITGAPIEAKIYPKFRRRQYVINPNFQWKMVTWGALLTTILVLCVYFYDLFLIRDLDNTVLASGVVDPDQWHKIMKEFETSRAISFSFFVVVVFFVVIWFYVLMSHRIAGPIFRTVKFLTENEHKTEGTGKVQEAPNTDENVNAPDKATKNDGAPVVEPPYGFQLRFRKKDFFPELADAVNKKLRVGDGSDK